MPHLRGVWILLLQWADYCEKSGRHGLIPLWFPGLSSCGGFWPLTGRARSWCTCLWNPWESESHSIMSNSLWPNGLYSPWNSSGQNTGMDSLSVLQKIFPTQGLNQGLPHCGQVLYQLSHKGNPRILEWVACPFSSGSSWHRNRSGVSHIAVDSLPTELSGKPWNP